MITSIVFPTCQAFLATMCIFHSAHIPLENLIFAGFVVILPFDNANNVLEA